MKLKNLKSTSAILNASIPILKMRSKSSKIENISDKATIMLTGMLTSQFRNLDKVSRLTAVYRKMQSEIGDVMVMPSYLAFFNSRMVMDIIQKSGDYNKFERGDISVLGTSQRRWLGFSDNAVGINSPTNENLLHMKRDILGYIMSIAREQSFFRELQNDKCWDEWKKGQLSNPTLASYLTLKIFCRFQWERISDVPPQILEDMESFFPNLGKALLFNSESHPTAIEWKQRYIRFLDSVLPLMPTELTYKPEYIPALYQLVFVASRIGVLSVLNALQRHFLEQTQTWGETKFFRWQDEHSEHSRESRESIYDLATSFCLEALRLSPPITSIKMKSISDINVVLSDGREFLFPEGTHSIFCLGTALMDHELFPNPEEFLLGRDHSLRLMFAGAQGSPHMRECPAQELVLNLCRLVFGKLAGVDVSRPKLKRVG